VDIQFSQQHFFEEAVISPLCALDSFVKNQLAIDEWVYIWIFYSDPLVFLSNYTIPQYRLKSSIVMLPALDFLLRIALGVRGLLCFHMYFIIAFSISVQKSLEF
jgi:hypothetical protein